MRTVCSFAAVTLTGLILAGAAQAQAINPQMFKKKFDEVKKDAELVAEVRVLTAVCTETSGEGKAKAVTLQLALQVLDCEKGPAKKNEILTVSRTVNLPSGPGPGMYGYQSAQRQFPFTPGVKGNVALRWDKEHRIYSVLAGWVPDINNAEIPREVGAVKSASEK